MSERRLFKGFSLDRAIASCVRRRQKMGNDIGAHLKKTLPLRASCMRRDMVGVVHSNLTRGMSLKVNGYPGSGKTELIIAILEKEYENRRPDGFGVILYPSITGGVAVHSPQLEAIWYLIDGGYRPSFLIIDEAADVVPRLMRMLEGKIPQSRDVDAAMLLDILVKLPDSTALMVSFPSVRTTNNGVLRSELMDFFGINMLLTMPSSFLLENFRKLISFRLGVDSENGDVPVQEGFIDDLAEYIGLYRGEVSTLLLRFMFSNQKNLQKIRELNNNGSGKKYQGVEQFQSLFEEKKLMETFSNHVLNGVFFPLGDLYVATSWLNGERISDEEFSGIMTSYESRGCRIKSKSVDSSVKNLIRHEIIRSKPSFEKRSLTLRALEYAIRAAEDILR